MDLYRTAPHHLVNELKVCHTSRRAAGHPVACAHCTALPKPQPTASKAFSPSAWTPAPAPLRAECWRRSPNCWRTLQECCPARPECCSTFQACCRTFKECCPAREACCRTFPKCCPTREACCATFQECCPTREECGRTLGDRCRTFPDRCPTILECCPARGACCATYRAGGRTRRGCGAHSRAGRYTILPRRQERSALSPTASVVGGRASRAVLPSMLRRQGEAVRGGKVIHISCRVARKIITYRSATVENSVDPDMTRSSHPIAHSAKDPNGAWREPHVLEDHLRGVATLATGFAEAFGSAGIARHAALWHDLGKYQPRWQQFICKLTKRYRCVQSRTRILSAQHSQSDPPSKSPIAAQLDL